MKRPGMMAVLVAGAMFAAVAGPAEIVSEGEDWPSHLQGVCSDSTNIWWSHATVLAKTDLKGKVLKQSEAVRYHHGDLCLAEGKLFVAVNLGRFNTEDKADSWVYAYDPDTLEFLQRWQLPANVHGAGGIAYHDGKFYVIGGLPPTHDENYVYEYDREFRLIRRHVLKSGWTNLGIQTADFVNGHFLFACYGGANKTLGRRIPNTVIVAPPDLSSCRTGPGEGAEGMCLIDGRMWKARLRTTTPKEPNVDLRRFAVKLVPAPELETLLPAAQLDRGGVTFDFRKISDERFGKGGTTSAFGCVGLSPSARVSSAPVNGSAGQRGRDGARPSRDSAPADEVRSAPGDPLTFVLPDDHGGLYAVSFRMKMTQTPDYKHEGHSNGGCFVTFDNGQGRVKLEMLVTSGDWLDYRREVKAPAGAKKMKLEMKLRDGATFEYENLAVRRLPSPAPVEMRLAGMKELGNTFAVSRGQVGLLSFYFRRQKGVEADVDAYEVQVSLPKGIEFVDTSFGDLKTKQTVVRQDGSSVTSFRWKDLHFYESWNHWNPRGILVRCAAEAVDGTLGDGAVRVTCRGKPVCDSGRIGFLAVPPIPKVEAGSRYWNGSDFGNALVLRLMNESASKEEYLKFMANCGYRMMIAENGDAEFNALVHRCGVRRFVAQCFGLLSNGYMFGEWPKGVPEAIRYVHSLKADDGYFDELNRRAVCPVAVYSESDWFRNDWLPKFRKAIEGADGVWANWEPYMFIGNGCFCDRCREAFREFAGLSEAELAKDWKQGEIPQEFARKYGEKWNAFRSREHGRLIRTVDKYVTEFTGGEKGIGFAPGVEWADMSSCRRDENLAAQYRPFEYAADLRWIEPWGPYAAWEADKPYFYQKYKPIAQFFAAADVKQEVERSCPAGKRPKLISYPHGFQGTSWVTQPETIALGLDSYFFNGWSASAVYFFPKGGDARYWRRFAEASARAGKYERYVLDGKDVTDTVTAVPVKEFAVPVSYATRYVPWSRNASMLQVKAYRESSRTIVAALNFWEKGEAFFDLKVKGLEGAFWVLDENGALVARAPDSLRWSAGELAAGIRLQVGAARTRVFEIVPAEEPVAPKAIITRGMLDCEYELRRPELQRAAEEDERYEKANPTPPRDYMPMI